MNTPSLSPRLGRVGRSVFSQLLHRLSQYQGKIYPLHVGDTYLEPAVSLDDSELKEERASLVHRYTPVRGAPSVVEAARLWLSERQEMEVASDEVIITGGGTAGLSALLAAEIQ